MLKKTQELGEMTKQRHVLKTSIIGQNAKDHVSNNILEKKANLLNKKINHILLDDSNEEHEDFFPKSDVEDEEEGEEAEEEYYVENQEHDLPERVEEEEYNSEKNSSVNELNYTEEDRTVYNKSFASRKLLERVLKHSTTISSPKNFIFQANEQNRNIFQRKST